MITISLQNSCNKSKTEFTNLVANPGGPFSRVIHSPGPTLKPGLNDSLVQDVTAFGRLALYKDLGLVAYTQPNVKDFLVVVAVMPVSEVGVNWVEPQWMYWIGQNGWSPPGEEGWIIGTSQTTKFSWGSIQVGVVPNLNPANVEVDIDFMDI